MSVGSIEFKVVFEDWLIVNFGNLNDVVSNVVMFSELKIFGVSNNNLMIEVVEFGLYEFKVFGFDGNVFMLMVIKK